MYNGFINILKPTGMTSHDVVGKIRHLTKIKKVGHTGTLDPNAAGVLPICIGNATKFSEYVMAKDKIYIAEIRLGKSTDTLDSYGNIIEQTENIPEFAKEEIEFVLNKFKGIISQIPPKYSAIKINGKKLYELARNNKEIPDIKPRQVEIKKLELLNYENNNIKIEVECSSGTYIRTLATDIGYELGKLKNIDLPSYMSLLIRTKAGEMKIEDSFTLEEIEKFIQENQLEKIIVPSEYMLKKYKSMTIKSTAVKSYTNGAVISNKGYEGKLDKGTYRVYDDKGNFYGIGEAFDFEEKIVIKSKTLNKM